jgi:hypothetical protein
MPQCGGLAFETCQLIGFLDCKFDETWAPGSGPMMDEELADRWEEADLIQEAVYSEMARTKTIPNKTILQHIFWLLLRSRSVQKKKL